MNVINLTNDRAFLLNEEKLDEGQSRKRIQQMLETVRLVGLEEWVTVLWVEPELTQFDVFNTLGKFLPDDLKVVFILPTPDSPAPSQ